MPSKYSFVCILSAICLIFCCSVGANPFLQDNTVILNNGQDDEGALTTSVDATDKAVIIVLDASGSMADVSETGETKMLAAKRVLERVLTKIGPSAKIGLRVYGSDHSVGFDHYASCQDTKLLVQPQAYNRNTIINKLRDIRPTGSTPISLSMKAAIRDLNNINAEHKSVVLISDGVDTCGYDPCLLSQSIKKSGLNIQFNVIGFGISNDLGAINQLQCVAHNTDGKFYSANNANELSKVLIDGMGYRKSVTSTISEPGADE